MNNTEKQDVEGRPNNTHNNKRVVPQLPLRL